MKLSNRELKKVDIQWLSDTAYPQLDDDLVWKMNEELKTNDVSYDLGYILSNSQGNGVCFMSGDFSLRDMLTILKIDLSDDTKKILGACEESFLDDYDVSLKHGGGHYFHEMSFDLIEEDVETVLDDLSDNFTNNQINFIDEEVRDIEGEFITKLQEACKEVEKYGYECIEYAEKENALNGALQEFWTENGITTDMQLWDIEYKESKEEGYILIADGEDMELWIKDYSIEVKEIKKEIINIK